MTLKIYDVTCTWYKINRATFGPDPACSLSVFDMGITKVFANLMSL